MEDSKEQFIEKLLKATRYSTNSYPIEFLPRKTGLGFNLKVEGLNKNILKPIFKKLRSKETQIEPKKEESDESLDKFDFIMKKAKKRRS